MRLGPAIALLALLAGLPPAARAAGPGTQYPSQKVAFADPVTGRTVWRMTTDGAQHGAYQQAAGDQSSESSSFSPDSTRIVYSKNGMADVKPDGVYVMDLASGVETFLAPARPSTPRRSSPGTARARCTTTVASRSGRSTP